MEDRAENQILALALVKQVILRSLIFEIEPNPNRWNILSIPNVSKIQKDRIKKINQSIIQKDLIFD